MDCLDCTKKSCVQNGADCFKIKASSLHSYKKVEYLEIMRNSEILKKQNRPQGLSRLQELTEFCRIQGYRTIGIAYCKRLEKSAKRVKTHLQERGFSLVSARCSIGGIHKQEISSQGSASASSCNPAGQAGFLNQRADFVVEMGLCMGHDVILHQELRLPFTVLVVKDRVHEHDPLAGITPRKDSPPDTSLQ